MCDGTTCRMKREERKVHGKGDDGDDGDDGETGLGVRQVSGDADADGERRGEVVSGPFSGIQSQSEGRGFEGDAWDEDQGKISHQREKKAPVRLVRLHVGRLRLPVPVPYMRERNRHLILSVESECTLVSIVIAIAILVVSTRTRRLRILARANGHAICF